MSVTAAQPPVTPPLHHSMLPQLYRHIQMKGSQRGARASLSLDGGRGRLPGRRAPEWGRERNRGETWGRGSWLRTGCGSLLVQTGLLGRIARVRRADTRMRRLETGQTQGVVLHTTKEELGFHLRKDTASSLEIKELVWVKEEASQRLRVIAWQWSAEINPAWGNFSMTSAALSTDTRNWENGTPNRRPPLQESTACTPGLNTGSQRTLP